MADFKEKDQQQRDDFIDFWVNYMKNHSDREWSVQQNVLINSVLKSATQLSREEYLRFKKGI
ncbi:hypothetical protein HYT55_04680 [Candidatus Woesearchaeota archaeon]|nr:hypothetical protein [Candidatus Woesearchaeota archaeon]